MNHALRNIWNELQEDTEDGKAVIYSDSIYAIKCLTKWPNKWTQNGWLNVHGQTISNYDLVTKTMSYMSGLMMNMMIGVGENWI